MKLAIIDMYNGEPNQGMRCIREIIEEHPHSFDSQVFDVRKKHEIPYFNDFDVYIFTGGPGNPLEGKDVWVKPFYQLIEDLWQFNLEVEDEQKKHVFFICHSFQMASHYFNIGKISKRKSYSFGTFPVYKTADGEQDDFFEALPNPFYIADFRAYQLVEANEAKLEEMGVKILFREKIRPHIPLERAIMGVRFSKEILGMQFHPEADPDGMTLYFQEEERRANVIEQYGLEKYKAMIRHLQEEDKIPLTHRTILPEFLNRAVESRVPVVFA